MTDPMEGIGPLDGPDDPPPPPRMRQTALLAITLLCLLPEIVLTGSDYGLWGQTRWRATAFQNAGFWSGLLGTWTPNYPLQPYAMFLTYGFLHAGITHFVVNMITLWSLGEAVVARIGQIRFLIVYTAAALGGAIAFALLSREIAPMVGASGALFGLAGALLAWDFRDRIRRRLSLKPVWRALFLLVLLNLVLWWAMDGHLAWQTHLGGFLTGWLFALIIDSPKRASDGA